MTFIWGQFHKGYLRHITRISLKIAFSDTVSDTDVTGGIPSHYDDVIMTMLASQITSLTVVYSIVYSGVIQRKHQSSASLAFLREIHRGPVNFPHKWPVTRKMFPFDDVIMTNGQWYGRHRYVPTNGQWCGCHRCVLTNGQWYGCHRTSLWYVTWTVKYLHDNAIKWKHFPRYWPFVRGIHRSPVNSPHKDQWRGALMFSFICAWINGWVNNGETGDLKRTRAHYGVTVMW